MNGVSDATAGDSRGRAESAGSESRVNEVRPHTHHELKVRDLHVHYGEVCALEDVSFDVSCGTCLALIGANGSGKSSLLKAIIGLVPPSEGEVLWRGRPTSRSSYEIAYLPQRELVDWDFPVTVRELVEMGRYGQLGPFRGFRVEDREAVDRALHTMRIDHLGSRHISALSGGQQQRTFIARALAQEPHVLLLDEPFNGLDRSAWKLMVELLKDLAQGGSLIVVSHHDINTAPEIFDVALLLKRRPIAYGPIREVLTDKNLARAFN